MSVARSSSLPADSLLGSPMEFTGQLRPSGACNLLEVPGLSSLDVDDDEGDFVIGIRPKSSPLPRRKSSLSDEDLVLEPPLCGSRRVSFADAVGLKLVQVKEFDIWDVPKLPDYDSSEGRKKDSEEYFISPSNFTLPLPAEELLIKVREQKVELETLELLPGTTILRGVIRVLNVSFDKAVYIRTSLDSWSSHFDLLAEYIPGSSEGLMDCFSFRLTLIPPFREQGARVDFCLRYETPVGTFWANNDNRNYTLFCHQRTKEEVEKPQKEYVKKKSCLKPVSQNFTSVENISAEEAPSKEDKKTDVSKQGEEETLKAKETFDDQSGTSEGNDPLVPTKSRRTCSRRSRRKAARMARVKDYFSQINGADDPEKDGPPSEGQSEQDSEVQSILAQDDNLSDHKRKSERLHSSDSSALRGDQSPSDTPNNIQQPREEPVSAEKHNISECESGAEESTQREEVCRESGQDSTDSVVSASAGSFTFGTVVAPLYHQVFVSADRGNLPLNVDTERRSAPIDASDSFNSDPELSVHASPHMDEETSPHREILQVSDEITQSNLTCVNSLDAPKTNPEENPNTAGISRTDVSDMLILAKSLDLQGEEQEKDLTPDLPQQTTAEVCTQVQSDQDEIKESLETLKSPGCDGDQIELEVCKSDETEEDETVTGQTAELTPEDDEGLKDSDLKETSESSDSCLETQEVTELQGSPLESLKHEDMISFCSTAVAEVKNWEMMVEEDEMNLLTYDEEISIQAGDIEAEEEDDIEQVEDTGRESASVSKDETVEEEEEKEDEETGGDAGFLKEEQVKDQNKEKNGGEDGETVSEHKDVTAEEDEKKGEGEDRSKEMEDEAAKAPDENEGTAGTEEVMDVKMEDKNVNVEFDESFQIEEANNRDEDEERRGGGGLDGVKVEDEEDVCFEERSESPQNETEDDSLARLDNMQEKRVNEREKTDEEFQTQEAVLRDEDGDFAEGGSCFSYDKLEDDDRSVDSASSGSDSDDEVELYMHCLRAVHTGPPVSKDSGFGAGRRSSVNRSKLLSSPMPSISESVDEEQNVGGLEETHAETESYEFTAAENQEDNIRPVSWWRETFSCRNIGKAFLYAALFLLFLVVAHHYDFLACFGLYLMSLVWLWFQGERPTGNSSKRIG